jgi:hypothetical protein
MNYRRPIHDFVGMTTDVSTLLRELCIVAVFCLLFFWPDTFKARMVRLGVSKVTIPGAEIDIKDAGGTVSTVNRGLLDTITGLQHIQSGDSHMTSEMQPIIASLTSLQQQAATTDATIKTTLVAQQASQEQTSPSSAKKAGWLLAGHVRADKEHWFGDSIQNIPATISPMLTVGEKISLSDTAYIRADAPSEQHFAGKVITVVPANKQVQVISAPDYSPAIAGGYFLWVKVQPL